MKFVPTMWLLRLYPPSPPVIEHRREWAVKGLCPAVCGGFALDRLPRLCFFSGKRRGYILQSRPLFQDWKRAGEKG